MDLPNIITGAYPKGLDAIIAGNPTDFYMLSGLLVIIVLTMMYFVSQPNQTEDQQEQEREQDH